MKANFFFITFFLSGSVFCMEEGSTNSAPRILAPISAQVIVTQDWPAYVGLTPVLANHLSPDLASGFRGTREVRLANKLQLDLQPNDLLFGINAFNEFSTNLADHGYDEDEELLPQGIFVSYLPFSLIREWKEGQEVELKVHDKRRKQVCVFKLTPSQRSGQKSDSFQQALVKMLQFSQNQPNYDCREESLLLRMGVLAQEMGTKACISQPPVRIVLNDTQEGFNQEDRETPKMLHGPKGFDFKTALAALESNKQDTNK